MKVAHTTIRLQDADPIARATIAFNALHTQHSSAGSATGSVRGPVGVGELAGRWPVRAVGIELPRWPVRAVGIELPRWPVRPRIELAGRWPVRAARIELPGWPVRAALPAARRWIIAPPPPALRLCAGSDQ